MIRCRQVFLWSLLCVVAPAAWTRADTATPFRSAADFVVREWHVDDGLPHEDVLNVMQDRHGYLWVACRGLVCRFDGSTFITDPAPEARNLFYVMAEDADGSLQLMPRDGDWVRYRDGKFEHEALPAPYAGRMIGYVLRAPDGAHWYSLRGDVLRVTPTGVEAFGADAGILAQNWTHFAADTRGRVWLAGRRLLARYERGQLVRVLLDADSSELRIFSSRRGGPWVITPSKVFKFDDADRAIEVGSISSLLGAHYVNAGCEDRTGALWLGTRSQGVHVFADGQEFHVPTSSDTINTLFEDRDGTIWVGAAPGGLSAIGPKVYTLYNKSAGLNATGVSAVSADERGDIWVANGDGGVARIRDSQIDHWTLHMGAREIAAGSVTRRPGGGVWATGGTGAAVFQVTDAGRDPERVEDVPGGGIHATTFTARNGDLWLVMTERQLGRLRGRSYRLFGEEDGLGASGVRTLTETPAGELLVGTNGGNLLEFDGNRFIPARWKFREPIAINAIQVFGQTAWLGTASSGIAICRESDTRFVGAAAGLPDDNITQLMPDGDGHVWCGSGRGIFRVTIADVERFVRGESRSVSPLCLGKDDGLGPINCQGLLGPGVARSLDGRIWFASRQGVMAVNPAAETLSPRAPVPMITQVLADETSQPLARRWVVDPKSRKLEVRFSALCLSAPSRVETRYRLSGFDGGWNYGRAAGSATYLRLPPGNYQFVVGASFGNWADEAATDSIDIVVPPLWWQHLWVSIAGGLIVVGAIVVVVRDWSHRRLRRRIENLERQTAVARVRDRIARDIHDEVGASLTRISLLTQTSAPNSPAVENLKRIDATAREVTRSLDEIVWAVNPHHDTLESFVSYLADFAQKFLGTARIRFRLLIPPALPALPLASEMRHDLFLCCREALNNVVKHAGASEVVIRLAYAAPTLAVTIADNGRGLLAERPPVPNERIFSGNGLANLRERMERLGGTCTIESPATGGTTVTLAVALPESLENIL